MAEWIQNGQANIKTLQLSLCNMHAAKNLCIISSVLPAVLFDILCKFHCKIIGANRLALPTRTLESRQHISNGVNLPIKSHFYFYGSPFSQKILNFFFQLSSFNIHLTKSLQLFLSKNVIYFLRSKIFSNFDEQKRRIRFQKWFDMIVQHFECKLRGRQESMRS